MLGRLGETVIREVRAMSEIAVNTAEGVLSLIEGLRLKNQ